MHFFSHFDCQWQPPKDYNRGPGAFVLFLPISTLPFILRYNRNGNKTFAGKLLAMDSLVYSYKTGTNKLDFIDDKVNASNYDNDIDAQLAGNYEYDGIGNLVTELGISMQLPGIYVVRSRVLLKQMVLLFAILTM